MSTLTFEKMKIRSAHLNGQAPLPQMRCNGLGNVPADLPEEDGLFLNYGRITNMLPYQEQDRYDRALEWIDMDVAVLENSHLKATFAPDYGGKLWSLYDKDAGKDLLDSNPVVRPCNLALRNAWTSGGVEWNIGMTGHSPFTCSRLFTARLTGADGQPILRFYEYERKRGSVYQMDFSLPADSRFLLCRMRIFNPNEGPIPMYWWSNVAVDENEGSRMIVPAEDTYITGGGYDKVCRRPIPCPENIDVTYGTNSRNSIDFFFHITGERRYMTHLDKTGYGLVQTSTSRQKGRKLFLWGQGAGGRRWQRYLTEGGKPYVEIQAGVACTQLECLPMPGRTAWEWMEAYGPCSVAPADVHGEWDKARATVESYLDGACPQTDLEKRLNDTRADALRPADEVIFTGEGWGALEKLRREKMQERNLPGHLDFGSIQQPQKIWEELIEKGALPQLSPEEYLPSYEINAGLMKLLRRQKPDFASELMLGLAEYDKQDYERAKVHFENSLRLGYSCVGLYALGNCYRGLAIQTEDAPEEALSLLKQAAEWMVAALRVCPEDVSLARETFRFLTSVKAFDRIVKIYPTLPEEVRSHPNMKLIYARSLAMTGDLAAAEAILYENGGLEIPDLREGENSITDLWYYIEGKKAEARGETFDPKTVTPPDFANFRMMIE